MTHYTSGSDWIWHPTRLAIYARDGKQCFVCRRKRVKLTLDHVIPVCRGGSNAPTNLITLCLRCNSSRQERAWAMWRPELVESLLEQILKPIDRAEGKKASLKKRPGRVGGRRIRDELRRAKPPSNATI